jgi:hypothetical protein
MKQKNYQKSLARGAGTGNLLKAFRVAEETTG